MIPFLKGIHLTLDSWRPNRKEDGWKMSNKEWLNFLCSFADEREKEKILEEHNKNHPDRVEAKPRLKKDLEALNSFFEAD